MIDPNSQFFAILTAVGEAKQANADALGIPWKLTELGVGDANGTDPIPDRAQTKLINERRRRPLNKLSVDAANPNIIVAEQIIPADEGGWWIREIGLYDSDGALVAVANCAPSYKPLMSQGSGRTQVVRMNFIVSSAANVVLKIDPAVVLATRQYVDETTTDAINKQDMKQSVLVATTGPIQLAGSPTVDGVVVPLGSRVLVKDQAQARDNGIYLTADIWKRTTDADSSAKVTPGLLLGVEQGTVNADTLWLLSTDGPIVLGTTPLTFKGVTQGLAPINSPAFSGFPTAQTPPRFDSSKKLATTEGVQQALGSFATSRGINETTVLTAADVGLSIGMGGTTSYDVTLPDIGDVPAGASIGLHCRNEFAVTIKSKTGSQISPNGEYLSSLVMRAGANAIFVKEGSVWCAYGTAGLKYSAQFAASNAATSGYQKLPSGDIEQWGIYISAASGTDTVIPLPIAMLAAPTQIQLTFANFTNGENVGSSPVLQARNSTAGSITVRNLYNINASFFWQVRGKA